MKDKSLIVLKSSNDICSAELANVQSIARMLGIKYCCVEMKSMDDFLKSRCSRRKYDYIYLAAHADPLYFGTADAEISISWEEFASALCTADCLNPDCILLLGCCRGGLKGVAQLLFDSCDRICYVCGPRWTVTPHDIVTGFHVFLYNMEVRKEQPSAAAARASHATNFDFFCYDRVELDDETNLLCRVFDRYISAATTT